MSLGTAQWLHRAMWSWLIWIGLGALCHFVVVALRGDALARLSDYPAGSALEIAGVPLLLFVLSRVRNPQSYRAIALGTGCVIALAQLAITAKGFPAVQLVYLGLALTVPQLIPSREGADSRPG